MFKNKKVLKSIEAKLKELEYEKKQLMIIKSQLEDISPKIDISDVYVFEKKGIYSLVKLKVENIQGYNFSGYGKLVNGYKTTLIDLFNNEVVYQKQSIDKMNEKEYISRETIYDDSYFVYFYSIYKFAPYLLAYPDKKVPLYVLQQLYYNLNDVNLDYNILEKHH